MDRTKRKLLRDTEHSTYGMHVGDEELNKTKRTEKKKAFARLYKAYQEYVYHDGDDAIKVFVSHHMTGCSDAEQLAVRIDAINLLRKINFDFGKPIKIVDNFLPSCTTAGDDYEFPSLWYLGRDITMMGKADFVFFVDDYESSTGCSIEYDIADSYHVPIFSEYAYLFYTGMPVGGNECIERMINKIRSEIADRINLDAKQDEYVKALNEFYAKAAAEADKRKEEE